MNAATATITKTTDTGTVTCVEMLARDVQVGMRLVLDRRVRLVEDITDSAVTAGFRLAGVDGAAAGTRTIKHTARVFVVC